MWNKFFAGANHLRQNPSEVVDLDNLVNQFLTIYDENIASLTTTTLFSMGSASKEECMEKESAWEMEFNAKFNEKCLRICHRVEIDEHDCIARRRRMMNRRFQARHGKLYNALSNGSSSSSFNNNYLKEQSLELKQEQEPIVDVSDTNILANNAINAINAIKSCIESFNETKTIVESYLPCPEACIIEEFHMLSICMKDQITNYFPLGENILEEYSSHTTTTSDASDSSNLPTLSDLKVDIEMELAHFCSLNNDMIEESILDVKQAIRAYTIEKLTNAINDIQNELDGDFDGGLGLGLGVPFLENLESKALMNQCSEQLDHFLVNNVDKIMDQFAFNSVDIVDVDVDADYSDDEERQLR